MELEWWKLLSQQTRQNPITTAEIVQAPTPKAIDPKTDINFEAVGAAAGATIGFATYVWTYPIVWIDGPLPIIDALWLGGLALATHKGARIGARYGRRADLIEEVLL